MTRQGAHCQALVTAEVQGQASSPAGHVLGDSVTHFSEPQFPRWEVGVDQDVLGALGTSTRAGSRGKPFGSPTKTE